MFRPLRFIILPMFVFAGGGCFAFSVLTHEAIIDASWDTALKPELLRRFPNLTKDQLTDAHSYAYGGAIIQDMGYYPFGSHAFSDMVHYVRSGDFVLALLREAKDPNEFAFALGALAHYVADEIGHPEAINHAVPMLYPKLKRKYGDPTTYEDDPGAHLKTEFGFDVLEVAKQRYAPSAYHDFIGFHVSKELLERVFPLVYGIPLSSLFGNLDLALGSFRYSVKTVIPEMTKAAWDAKKDEIGRTLPGMTRRRFVYNMSRASFEKEWGHTYERPGIGARIIAFLFRFLPKIGPLRALGFKVPTPQAEKMFLSSLNDTLARYRQLALEVGPPDRLQLTDRNLDTGQPVRQGKYRLADKAYATLLEKLADQKNKTPIDPILRRTILTYYQQPPKLSSKAKAELTYLSENSR